MNGPPSGPPAQEELQQPGPPGSSETRGPIGLPRALGAAGEPAALRGLLGHLAAEAQELGCCHNMDIWYMIWFLDYGNLN